MVLLLAVYLTMVFSVTGLPTAYTLQFDLSVNLVPLADIVNSPLEYVKNTLLNIVLFMPLGFLLPVIWREYRL
jgi:glycopeptide antibiotics resistance protein